MRTITTLLLLFVTTSHIQAASNDNQENLKEYDVEIIIFEDAHARYLNSEMWPQNKAENIEDPAYSGKASKKAATRNTAGKSFKNIKPAILKQEYRRIKNSSQYTLLFYGAWRQPGLDQSRAFDIDIKDLINRHKSRSENSLSGELKVVLSRYLHFYSELEYQRKQAPESSEADLSELSGEEQTPGVKQTDIISAGNNIYTIKSHRRMRSRQLHYIDHPLVGILIQINPVAKPE